MAILNYTTTPPQAAPSEADELPPLPPSNRPLSERAGHHVYTATDMRAYVIADRQARAQAAAPREFVLVPVEPTYTMLKAGGDECDPPRTADAASVPIPDIYRAMLAAAPANTRPLSEVIAEFERDPEKKAMLIAAREQFATAAAPAGAQPDVQFVDDETMPGNVPLREGLDLATARAAFERIALPNFHAPATGLIEDHWNTWQEAWEAAVAAERERCRDLVRRYMPVGWSAVYDAISDAQHAAGMKG